MSDINTDEETVLIARNTTTKKYHTSADCAYVTDRHSPRRLSIAKAWGYSECSLCKHGASETYGQHTQEQSFANAIRDQQRNE